MNKLFLAILGLIALSCNQNPNQFKLTGTIRNAISNEVLIYYADKVDTIRLDSGRFEWTVQLEEHQYIELVNEAAVFTLFVAPNEDLSIAFNYANAEELPVFEGSLTSENDYLAERAVLDYQLADFENELYASDEADFIVLNDSLRNIRLAVLEEAKPDLKAGIAAKFLKLEQEIIDIKWLNKYLERELYYPYLKTDEVYIPSEQFKAYRSKVNPNQGELVGLKDYVDLVENYIEVKKKKALVPDAISENNEEKIKRHFAMVDKNITNDLVSAELKYRAVEKYLATIGIEGIEGFLKAYIAKLTDAAKKEKLQMAINDWAKLKSGEQAPDFNAIDILGNPVSLKQLKGKNVYLSIWTTWSGPSRLEIPAFDSIAQLYATQNVVFVHLSIDESQETWYRTVKETQLKGNQWFAEKEKVIEAYNLNAIPRYVLLDIDGKIVHANAAKPNGGVVMQLDNLLKKAA